MKGRTDLRRRWSHCITGAAVPKRPAAKRPSDESTRNDPMSAKKGDKQPEKREDENERLISQNRSARHEYDILDTVECGIVLVGSEVKSLRNGKVTLDEAYGRVKGSEVWLVGCDIPEYVQANQFNHEPRRPRKLLLHRREIAKFAGKAFEKGLTLVPLKLYFKNGKAKLLLGVGKGRKLHDKRQAMKKRDAARDIGRAMRRDR
jgi:SsrA-binding protein